MRREGGPVARGVHRRNIRVGQNRFWILGLAESHGPVPPLIASRRSFHPPFPPVAEDDVHQPHDSLFRSTFARVENTAALLSALLPPPTVGLIDWSGLRLLPGSFVDSHLRSFQTDLLFSAPVAGQDLFIYVLLEHQSTRDPWLSLRLLRYMVRVWEVCADARESKPGLPVILPVVMSQTAEQYTPDPRFVALLNLPAPVLPTVQEAIPDFAFTHVPLAGMAFDQIPGTPAGILALRALKAARLGRLLDDAVWDEELIRQVPPELLHRLFRYIFSADIDNQAFLMKIASIKNAETRSTAMTLAQRFHREGQEEGLRQGRQEGRLQGLALGRTTAWQEAVVSVLATRFASVPDGLRESIAGVESDSRLAAMLKAATECRTLEEFAESL